MLMAAFFISRTASAMASRGVPRERYISLAPMMPISSIGVTSPATMP